MERIKQALERAREERLKNGGSIAHSDSPASISPPGQILYTHTRTEEVPLSFLREQRVISAVETGSFTDAYRILRTQILQRLQANHWNVLAITSPGADEGKTLTAINLGISLAKEVDHTVLLVDADLRNPGVHKYFGISPERGLSEYLTEDAPLADLLIHPSGIGRFVILPGGKPIANSSEMLNSPKMARLVEDLKNRYPSRIVLFDLPPLLSSADALAFSPHVDAALLVIEESKTPVHDIQRAQELLRGTQLIGTVLNKSREARRVTETRSGWAENAFNRLRDSKLIDVTGSKLRVWIDRLSRRKR